MEKPIAIIDYKLGNAAAIQNMLNKLGLSSLVTSKQDDIKRAEKIILPGIGSFDAGVKNLHELGIFELLRQRALNDKIPILGICLGMQLLTRKSEEGELSGLRLLEADTVKFMIDKQAGLKIPHMGWNHIKIVKHTSLFQNTLENQRFYFAHSYHINCDNRNDVVATATYGYEFISAVNSLNIFGVQFHPEKSHKFGMSVLNNFANLH